MPKLLIPCLSRVSRIYPMYTNVDYSLVDYILLHERSGNTKYGKRTDHACKLVHT